MNTNFVIGSDNTGKSALSDKAKRFVEDFLSCYDLTKLRKLHVCYHNQKYQGYVGYAQNADHKKHKHKGGSLVTAKIPNAWANGDVFPHTTNERVYTATYDDGSYTYLTKRHVVNDTDEAFIFVIGHELFHFLRQTKQIESEVFGTNTEPSANRFGIIFHYLYKNGRKWSEIDESEYDDIISSLFRQEKHQKRLIELS